MKETIDVPNWELGTHEIIHEIPARSAQGFVCMFGERGPVPLMLYYKVLLDKQSFEMYLCMLSQLVLSESWLNQSTEATQDMQIFSLLKKCVSTEVK